MVVCSDILPIHAAGYHELNSSRTAIDRVISSYIPTLKSLGFARERRVRLPSQKALIVGMPTTPEQCDLPYVDVEIEALRNLFSTFIETTTLRNPTREATLLALPEQQIVHLSCHGRVSENDPSQSSLLLDDWKKHPLTISDLISVKMKAPQFAFLSTCHSATARDERLADESINLASTFHLAGFPSVVGTLWQVTDEHSFEVGKDVYQWMLDEHGKLDVGRAAVGLHHAIRRLRQRTRRVSGFFKRSIQDAPLIWAAYVHVGV